MKNFTNDNIINILFFLGLFIIIYLFNIFMGTAIFERIVTNLFIYIILLSDFKSLWEIQEFYLLHI